MENTEKREFEARVRGLIKDLTDSDGTLTLLRLLKDGPAPTEEMLRTTKAGVIVNRMRANTNREVAVLATELVSKWKRLVEAEKARNKLKAAAAAAKASNASNADHAPSFSEESHLMAITTPLCPPEDMQKPFTGDPEKRNADNDGVDIKRTGDHVRNNVIKILYNGLSFKSSEPVESLLARAAEIEAAAFEAYDGTTATYKNKCRSLMFSLKNKTNRALGENVMSGDIAPSRLVVMTPEELKSEEQRARDQEIERENMKKAQVPTGNQAVAPGRQCSRCKEHMVWYTQAQTRSADEPMTTFFVCGVCDHRWKE